MKDLDVKYDDAEAAAAYLLSLLQFEQANNNSIFDVRFFVIHRRGHYN